MDWPGEMIKAGGRTALGAPLLFLGLSGENVTRLVAGEPIRITAGQLTELGLPPMVIAIAYGRTEDHIRKELEDLGVISAH